LSRQIRVLHSSLFNLSECTQKNEEPIFGRQTYAPLPYHPIGKWRFRLSRVL
jgi:hypothetical protein